VPSIQGNSSIRHWASALSPPDNSTNGGRPLLNLSFAANYAAGGLSVGGYHAVNLAIHVLAALVLFGIARRAFRGFVDRPDSAAFSLALLWAVHPLLTESVTYTVQRAESLMGLAYLLTLYCFVRGAEGRGRRAACWLALSAAACLLGMGTKEVMVTAPLVVLAYDRTFIAGSFGAALRRRPAAYAALAATWVPLLFLVASTHGRAGTAGFGTALPWYEYARIQCAAIVHYVRLAAWPSPLVFDYPTRMQVPAAAFLCSALALAAAAAGSAWGLARGSAAGFLGAAFLVILAPSSSVVPVVTEVMAEHRMYLPLAALLAFAVAAAYRRLRGGAAPACCAAAALLLALTWMRNSTYASAEDLWLDTIGKCPDNDRARNNLGYILELRGQYDEAEAQYDEALRLNPADADAHDNLGGVYIIRGKLGPAEAEFADALRIRPKDTAAENGMGNILALRGRFREATGHYERAVELAPDNAEAEDNLGNALEAQGRVAEAIPHLEAAVGTKPSSAEMHRSLGAALVITGRTEKGIAEIAEAIRLDPRSAAAHNDLANALRRSGKPGAAVAQYLEAARLAPSVAGYHVNAAIAIIASGGDASRAVAELRAALRADPGDTQAREVLSRVEVSGR
jgi:Flp pilus assembly protein TadD